MLVVGCLNIEYWILDIRYSIFGLAKTSERNAAQPAPHSPWCESMTHRWQSGQTISWVVVPLLSIVGPNFICVPQRGQTGWPSPSLTAREMRAASAAEYVVGVSRLFKFRLRPAQGLPYNKESAA